MTHDVQVNRRKLLGGSIGTVAALALLGNAAASPTSRSAPAFLRGQSDRKLTFWIMDPGNQDALKQVLPTFKESTGIDVTVEVVPWGDVFGKWTTSFEAGSGADVSQCGGMGLFPAAFWDQGRLMDLSDVLADIGEENYYSVGWGKYGGAVTSTPWFLETRVMFYRKDWFVGAGIEPPTTWDELLSAAKELTRDGKYGLALPFSKEFFTGQTGYTWYINDDTSAPLDLVDENLKPAVQNPNAIEGYATLTSYLLQDKVVPQAAMAGSSADLSRLFTTETVAMVIGNGSFISQCKQENPKLIEDDKVGAFQIPSKSGPGYSFLGGSAVWVNKQTQNPDGAKEFVKFLANPETQLTLAKANALAQPSAKAAAADADLNADPLMKMLNDQLAMTKAYLWQSGPDPRLAKFYSDFTAEQPVLDVVVNGKTVEEALATFSDNLAKTFS